MEADMLAAARTATPASGSLEDAVSWQVARKLETPPNGFSKKTKRSIGDSKAG